MWARKNGSVSCAGGDDYTSRDDGGHAERTIPDEPRREYCEVSAFKSRSIQGGSKSSGEELYRGGNSPQSWTHGALHIWHCPPCRKRRAHANRGRRGMAPSYQRRR